MREIVLGFFQVMMRSLVLMSVMLTICLSLITREFPPDFSRIWRTYQSLQSYNKAAAPEAQASGEATAPNASESGAEATNNFAEETEVQKLSDLYEKRAKIGRSLLDPGATAKLSTTTKETTAKEGPAKDPAGCYNGEVEILRARLLTCEDRLNFYEAMDPDSKSQTE